MADEVISTKIVADADFSGLIADVHKVTASLSKLQEQLASSNKMLANNVAVINRNFSDTIRSTGQFSSHFVSLTSDVEKFGKNLDSGRLKLRDYFNTYQGHIKTSGGLIRELAKQQVAMQNAVLQPLGRNAQGLMQFNVHVPRGLDAIKSKTALARQELQIMNKVIQDGAVQLINWGKNTQWAGRQLTVGLTLPLAAFGKAAADAFKQADQELTRLTKVYGDVAGTSTQELGRVRREVIATSKELSAAYGTNFNETISLAADIAATGKKGQELLDSVKETSRLAVLGEVDRQEAMKATLAIQSAFKSNTEELTNSINFLNAVENQTSTTLNDLVEAIPKAGPVIKGLGGSVQDLALYLTAMREGGISASEGANALKSALASLINPTDKAVEKFKTMGIDLLGIVNDNAGNVTETLLALQASLDKLNPLQKQQAIEQLFGKFQFSRLNALFENLGRQGSQTLQVLDLMKASTSDLAAVAGRELTAVTESASGKYRRALESLKADLAGIGEQFLTIGTKIITVVDKALDFFNGLPKPIKQAITFLGALTAVAGPLIMLTGVLANFFGYILKGVMHMKAFFKGGEGWKYLTPEMMAAEKAGKLIEQTFYSDAKAASILQLALKNLIDEFSILEAKAKSGSISVNPAVSTMAGNLIMGAGGRVVNPQHPLAGPMGTRASTHMVPRASMTEEQRMSQTIFGLVPGSIPVNRKIGDAPQIYMNDPLPPVPGLTTIGGVSTGVVSGEAARWHAMMATLAMQSKSEIEALKKQIATTGVVSKDFMNQFDDILPVVSGITDNAAKQSALIVAELRAGKLTVEQARQQIIALNLEIERMITSAVGQQAAAMGRTINPTMVPTLNQPVVDPTGKSNMRELFKKSKTRDLIDKISRSLGVRTSGAGYNIETTKPKKFAAGGTVVPGPRSDTTDTQYMTLNAGDFVLNRKASDALLGFSRGGEVPAMVTPGEIVIHSPSPDEVDMLSAYNNQFAVGGMVRPNRMNYGRMTPANALAMFRGATKFFGASNYTKNMRIGTIASDAAILHGMGMDPKAAIQMASADYDDAIRYATGKDGTFSLNRFTQRRNQLLKQVQQYGSLMGISGNAVAQVTPGGRGARRATGFSRFDAGIGNIYKMLMGSGNFDQESKKYLKSLNLLNTTGYRSTARAHFQRYQTQDVQGQEYLYQASPIPATVNSFLATTESKRLGRDLLPPVAEGRGGATGFFQRILQNAAARGGYNRAQVPGFSDVLASSRKATPLQRMLQAALSASFTRRPMPVMRNSGGMIPGYNRGGLVGYRRGSKKGVGEPGDGGMPMGGGMGMMFAGMGLQMAGQTVGGGTGQVLSSVGMAANLMSMLQMIPKVNIAMGKLTSRMGVLNAGTTKASQALAGKASSLTGLSRAFGPVLRGLSFLTRGFGPLGLAITGTILAVKGLNKLYQDHQETLRIGRLEYGMSSEAIKKAGYSLTDYNGNVKKAIEDAKALQERNKMLYETMFNANIPIKMTIAEYKKLRKEVKEKMPDMIELFNQKSNSEVTTTATRLKAQFMSMGDSVETATAKVYALMAQSNKAQMAASAIGSDGFGAIKDSVDAAVASAGSFDDAMKKGDAKAASDSLLITFQGIGNAIEDNAKKNKLEFGDSMDQVLKQMVTSGKGQVTINKSVLDELKKQNPELAKILNSTDTATSAWAKYQLALKGVNLDLQSLSGEAANAALKLQAVVSANTATTLRGTVGIKKQYAEYDTLQKRIKDLQKASKGQSVREQIDSRKVIEGLNDQIKKIKEKADAKIKALRAESQAQNDELELQKLQLEYQEAIARGDQDAAARAQIALQQFTNQVQSKKAEEAIIAKAELEIKPLQDQIDKLNNKNKELADKAALAGESLSKLQEKAGTLKEKLDNLEKSVSAATFNKILYKALGLEYAGSEQEKTDFAGIEGNRKALGLKPSITNVTKKGLHGQTITTTQEFSNQAGGAKNLVDSVAKGLENGVDAKTVNLYTSQLNSNGTSPGGRTKSSPLMIKQDPSLGLKKDGQLDDDSEKRIIREYGLQKGEYFRYGDVTYEVLKTGWGFGDRAAPVKRHGGGAVSAGQTYMFNDRIGPLGAQQEGFLPNVAKAAQSGFIYPNINTMPRYNIPSNTVSGVGGGPNNSYNNNVYNIDIALNGTNVTADDVMRKFEEKMSAINARQGRPITVKPTSRSFGGSH